VVLKPQNGAIVPTRLACGQEFHKGTRDAHASEQRRGGWHHGRGPLALNQARLVSDVCIACSSGRMFPHASFKQLGLIDVS